MTTKSGDLEDEYFTREDALKLQALAQKKAKETAAAELEALRKAHWMRCAKCGFEMKEVLFKGVTIDKCFNCGYVGLDDGELEQLAGKAHNVIESLVAVFRRGA